MAKTVSENLFQTASINFQIFTAGLIASPKKTIQEINDAFSKGEQSSLNRFITKSEWDIDAVNPVRFTASEKNLHQTYTIQVIDDDTLFFKTGKQMEKAGWHRSGVTKKIE